VVDVLRERFPERVAAEFEVVARHAEAAGRSDDAITSYGRAGERAQACRSGRATATTPPAAIPGQAVNSDGAPLHSDRIGSPFGLDRRLDGVFLSNLVGPFFFEETIWLSCSSPRPAFRMFDTRRYVG
jgi:hypothetical protein